MRFATVASLPMIERVTRPGTGAPPATFPGPPADTGGAGGAEAGAAEALLRRKRLILAAACAPPPLMRDGIACPRLSLAQIRRHRKHLDPLIVTIRLLIAIGGAGAGSDAAG